MAVGGNSETFTGNIINSAGGILSGADTGIVLDYQSTFAGNVTNAGKIVAGDAGMLIKFITDFDGGVTNTGTISSHRLAGIMLSSDVAFGQAVPGGGIVNTGVISAAATGIAVNGSTISGSIIDSGTIVATSHGIAIDGASEIVADGVAAIDITGKTFTGGIVNSGAISGAIGIDITSMQGVSIFDDGTIVGSGGTAIEFHGSGNTLTLGQVTTSAATSMRWAATRWRLAAAARRALISPASAPASNIRASPSWK